MLKGFLLFTHSEQNPDPRQRPERGGEPRAVLRWRPQCVLADRVRNTPRPD